MNNNLKASLFLLLSATASQTVMANTISQLEQHLEAKEYHQAHQLAEQLTYEYGGESEFDLMAGIAAFGSDHYQEAVFAFERVVLVDPDSFNGRYYLALCYRKLNNLDAAIAELTKLSANTLTEEQQAKVDNQLSLLDEQLVDLKRSWSHSIALILGDDSNINGGTSLDEVQLPDGTVIPLLDSSKTIPDVSYAARYQGSYQHYLNQYQSLTFNAGFHLLTYDNYDEYKRETYTIGAKYRQKLLNDAAWSVGISTAPLFFDNEKYRTQNALTFGWEKTLDSASDYGINASIADIDYSVYDNLDLTRYQSNIFYRYQTNLQHVFMLNAYQDNNKKGVKHNDRLVVALSYMLAYPIINQFTGNVLFSYEEQKYQHINPVFGDYNDSTLFYSAAQFNYTGFKNQLLQLQLSYQDKKVDSDIQALNIYQYDRFESSVTWKYKF